MTHGGGQALKEVGEEAHPTLVELAKQRLLVTGRDDSTGEETIEVAHEALIQHWSRLRQWLEEDRDFLTWRERLKGALSEWQRTGHDADVLLRGAPLAEAERWYGERQQDFGREERAYIQQSVRSRNRRQKFIWIGAAAAIILSVAVAFWQYNEAEQLRAARRPIIPEMIEIPAGKFMMGAAAGDSEAFPTQRPQHEVMLQKPFMIAKFEVTFDEYDKFSLATERRPANDGGWGGGKRPVINVSWDDAVAYAKWLSQQTGKRFRLPTEAEWEYVARAGTDSKYWWGNEMIKGMANCLGCGSQWDGKQTAPVGSFKPNPFGVYDTAGSVWEWVEDCWHENYNGAPTDGSPWLENAARDCGLRVIRGGSWAYPPVNLRSSSRFWDFAGIRVDKYGFRLAQDLP